MLPTLLLALGASHAATTATTTTTRVLSLAGVADLPVQEASGGDLVGRVQVSGTSKTIAGASIEPLEVAIPLGAFAASKATTWLADTLAGKSAASALCLSTLHATGKLSEQRCWTDATLEGFALSDLDAADRASASIRLRFSASGTTRSTSGDKPPTVVSSAPQALASSFKVSLGTLPTTRVASVQGVGAQRAASGASRVGGYVADDLVVALSAVDQEPWLAWFDATVGAGKVQELSMTVEVMDAAMKTPVLTLVGSGVGIYRAETSGTTDASSRLTARLYVEQWTVK